MSKAKKTTKSKAKIVVEPKTAPLNTAVKVLRDGASWHGGEHKWSLPTQAADGSWVLGEWTPRRGPVLCESGWHLTNDPGRWWGNGENVTAYLAEYDGPTDGPSASAEDDPTKFSTTRARLLRPLTTAELEAHNIYLSGEHGTVDKGRLVIGGTAHFVSVTGSARVDSMCDSARVDSMCDSARVDSMYGSASVGRMSDSASVGRMYGSARVGSMCDSASVGRMSDSARVGSMCDSARVDSMYGSARVGRMYGSARVDSMYGSATAHASNNAVLVLGGGAPTVTLRGRAACLDYRPARPVAHIAPEHGTLTINADATTAVTKENP